MKGPLILKLEMLPSFDSTREPKEKSQAGKMNKPEVRDTIWKCRFPYESWCAVENLRFSPGF